MEQIYRGKDFVIKSVDGEYFEGNIKAIKDGFVWADCHCDIKNKNIMRCIKFDWIEQI